MAVRARRTSTGLRMRKTVVKDVTAATWAVDAKKKALDGCVRVYREYPDACPEKAKIAAQGQELILGLGIVGAFSDYMECVDVSSDTNV